MLNHKKSEHLIPPPPMMVQKTTPIGAPVTLDFEESEEDRIVVTARSGGISPLEGYGEKALRKQDLDIDSMLGKTPWRKKVVSFIVFTTAATTLVVGVAGIGNSQPAERQRIPIPMLPDAAPQIALESE
jgi:hypothetical protein